MKRLAILLSALLLTPTAVGATDAALAKMMQTPASVFDLFLFRLYESGKCNQVVSNNNADEADLCLSSIRYDRETGILSAYFRVLPAAEVMDDFVDVEADERREILLQLLDNSARRFGAVDGWGLLHSLPLSHGDIDSADDKAFRAALARRTTTALSTSYDGVVYVATRHHDGEIEYFTRE